MRQGQLHRRRGSRRHCGCRRGLGLGGREDPVALQRRGVLPAGRAESRPLRVDPVQRDHAQPAQRAGGVRSRDRRDPRPHWHHDACAGVGGGLVQPVLPPEGVRVREVPAEHDRRGVHRLGRRRHGVGGLPHHHGAQRRGRCVQGRPCPHRRSPRVGGSGRLGAVAVLVRLIAARVGPGCAGGGGSVASTEVCSRCGHARRLRGSDLALPCMFVLCFSGRVSCALAIPWADICPRGSVIMLTQCLVLPAVC
mmetsp:Transcript_102597/g.278834  ORF Transcript_102597/g.278834 Transcript_102597/m.278834 type:complete len:251 (-) Transcript_102597:58-810(-)